MATTEGLDPGRTSALLKSVAGRVEALRAELLRFRPVLYEFVSRRHDQTEMRRQLKAVAEGTAWLVRAVEGTQVAAAEFRKGCRADQLARLNAYVRALSDEAQQMDRRW